MNCNLVQERDCMNSTAFIIFVLPFFIGIIIRLLFLKWKRGYILSGTFALLSVIAWVWTKYLVSNGVDGTVMLWALMATELAIGSLITDGISLLLKTKHQGVDYSFLHNRIRYIFQQEQGYFVLLCLFLSLNIYKWHC